MHYAIEQLHPPAILSGSNASNHLVKIPGEQWAFWRWICLRGAGFPASVPQQLAAPEIASATDRYLSLDNAIDEMFKAAIETCRTVLNETADQAQKKLLYRALKQLNKRRIPEPCGAAINALAEELTLLFSQAEQARVQFTNQFQAGALDSSAKIRKIAGDSQFRQAVLLQNRAAFRRVTHSFSALEQLPARRGFKERQNEELIASYLQRYCLKNDTIGFFGPVGWAKLLDAESPLSVHTGINLVSKSSIYFENWGVECLAQKMSAISSLRPWIAPRLLPFFRVDETCLYSPDAGVSELPPVHAAVLRGCNGEVTARELARSILRIPEYGIRTEGQVYGILHAYAARGIISWTFEIPYCLHPEKKLREFLTKIEKEDLRSPLLSELDELEQKRDRISHAIGDPERLDQALEELDAAFTRLTNYSPTKSAGAMYASRTLVYQECRRDVNVEMGSELLISLGLPLSLLLTSARWFSYQAATAYQQGFHHIYEELARANDSGKVELLQFWAKIEPLIFDPVQKLFNNVLPEFQNRWETILQVPWEKHLVAYKSADLKAQVNNLFASPAAGWQLARYHSPDVMIAAPSVDAIRRGDFMFVLGEVHMAVNTIRFSFAVSQHDKPEELFSAFESDLPESRAVPVPPRHWPRITNRTSLVLNSSRDCLLEVSSAPVANAPRSRTMPISAFAVERTEEGLIVQNCDGSLKFPIIEFFGELLSSAAIELLKIVRPRAHMPRIIIDKLVIARESWCFSAAELDFVHCETEHERYLQVRRWMRAHGLPRLVFVKVPVEVKPFYLDFESPIYVEIFIKMIRRILASNNNDGRVTLSEMLPTPGHVWLPDAAGQTYTSELRMVAWDLAVGPKVQPGK